MCCGKRITMKTNYNQAPRSAHIVPVLPSQGANTLLKFVGRGSNSRPFYGASGQRYLFGGKHHLTGYILDSDVDSMLAMLENGKPLFAKVQPVPVKAVIPVVIPVVPIAPVGPISSEIPVEAPLVHPKKIVKKVAPVADEAPVKKYRKKAA